MKAAEVALRELSKVVRAVEAQVQPVVEVIQPGPWSNPQRWNVERRRKAQQSVELAIVTWKSKHGGSEPKQC